MASENLESLNIEVARLLTDYRKRFRPDGREIAEHFKQRYGTALWERTKWSQILKSNPGELSLQDKLALVAANRLPSSDSVFEYAHLKVHDSSSAELKHDFDGHYRYWRFYRRGHRGEFTLRWGLVHITTTPEGHTSLAHWSYDVLQRADRVHQGDLKAMLQDLPKPEDVGIAIYTSRKLFMLGFRRENIRLGIADLPRHIEHLETEPMRGVVLTNKDDTDLYAATFLMFRESNPDFTSSLNEKEFIKHVGEITAYGPQRVIAT